MSFKSLVNKLMKEGKSKEAATKIAGKVASEKMKGAGSGPTAKQKARMKKSPAKKYDRVVLGGNKGDKSKTKPGKKDYEKSPAKKPLVGKQKNLPDHLKKAILDAPAKMLSKSGMKMMKDGSPAKREENVLKDKNKRSIIGNIRKTKSKKVTESLDGSTKTRAKEKIIENKRTGDIKTKRKVVTKGPTGRTVSKSKKTKNLMDDVINMYKKQYIPGPKPAPKPPKPEPKRKDVIIPTGGGEKSPTNKTKKKVEQDYARNAIADYKAGKKKEGNYEKKKALELAAGESGVMMKKSPGMMKTPMMKYDNSPALIKKAPTMMKTNQMGGGVAAKDSAAPAKQLKKLGSIISKHMKSN
jgi:hypothetical protein